MHITDGQGKARQDEKIVKRCDVQKGRQRCRTPAEPEGDQHRFQQEQHDDIGQVQERHQRQRQQGHADAAGQRPDITQPGIWRVAGHFIGARGLHRQTQVPGAGCLANFHNVQGGRQCCQPACHGAATPQRLQAGPATQARPTHHQRCAIEDLRLLHQRCSGVAAGQHSRACTQFLGQLDDRQNTVTLNGLQPLQRRRFHIRGMPAHIELPCKARGRAQGLLGAFARADAGQNRAFGVPDRCDGFFDAVTAHIVFHMLGGTPQCNFTQRNQVALAEKVLRCALGLLRPVDLAGLEAGQQLIGRHIDQHDFIGFVEHGVRHGLMHANAGDGAHCAVEAFKVLHIERRPDINAGFQQFLHILPALGMARPGHIAVRQFVHQQHGRMPDECRVKVKFGQRSVPVGQIAQRQLFEPGKQRHGFSPAMGFDHANQNIQTGLVFTLGGAEHGVGLADAGAGAQVDAQPAATGALRLSAKLLDELVRIGAGILAIGHQMYFSASWALGKAQAILNAYQSMLV